MLLGIDVGGTFTDAVVIKDGKVASLAKAQTTHDDLLRGITAAMDEALRDFDPALVRRVALSTTIVTNALLEGRTDRVGLLLIPGPGMDISGRLPEAPRILSGYIDHRGREVARPQEDEVRAACRELADRKVFAVAGKFAIRNPSHEQAVARWVESAVNPRHVTLASEVSGALNFLRRANAAYFNAAVWRRFAGFAAAITEAMRLRRIEAPVFVLKADGGTMPLAAAEARPVEAIFTGPAASVLGIMAMCPPAGQAVSLDIGGTSTDIAFWHDGVPLFAPRGAKVSGFPTSVRGFWLRSVGIGGDSFVRREGRELKIGPERLGPAAAAGGPAPTVSDAMIALGVAKFGDFERAGEAVMRVAAPGQSLREAAQAILDAAALEICRAIRAMLDEQAAEPVYRVEDIVNPLAFVPRTVVGVGGAAGGMVPFIAERLKAKACIPAYAGVANAIGAAVARPTLEITLRADSAQGNYTVAELGIMRELPSRRFGLADARRLGAMHLAERAHLAGVEAIETETVFEEEFNVIRGFSTLGKITVVRMQIKPGVLAMLDGQKTGETLGEGRSINA